MFYCQMSLQETIDYHGQIICDHGLISTGQTSVIMVKIDARNGYKIISGPQYDRKCSFYFNYFPYNSNKPRPQTESCVFSNVTGPVHLQCIAKCIGEWAGG